MNAPDPFTPALASGASVRYAEQTIAALAPFNYPPEVHAHFAAIVEVLRAELPLTTALLLGSTARGELSYRHLNSRLELFSDYELYALTSRQPPSAQIARMRARLDALAATWAMPGPFFHIDVSVNAARLFHAKLRRDRRISTFELASNARVLFGEPVDLRALLFPASRLDLGNTRELVLVRLWMQLLFTPQRVILGSASAFERDVFLFGLCRNILETLTILLPTTGVLLPNYTARFTHFNTHPDLHRLLPPGAVHPVPADFAKQNRGTGAGWQSAALRAKLTLDLPTDLLATHTAFLDQYTALLATFLSPAPPRPSEAGSPASLLTLETLITSLRASRGRFLNDALIPRLRRARRELRILRRIAREAGTSAALNWTRMNRRVEIIAFLLYFHLAANEILRGGDPVSALDRASAILQTLSPRVKPSGMAENAPARWLALRDEFARFMSAWMYNDPRYLDRWGILNWKSDD